MDFIMNIMIKMKIAAMFAMFVLTWYLLFDAMQNERIHPTSAERAASERLCGENPSLMGCDDPYYY